MKDATTKQLFAYIDCKNILCYLDNVCVYKSKLFFTLVEKHHITPTSMHAVRVNDCFSFNCPSALC